MASGYPRIVLAVTSDVSLVLMRGFPEYLVSQGWDVHVVSSPGPLLDELSESEGITVHPLRMAREPSPLRDVRSLVNWIRLLRRLRPDVVSAGTPKAGLLATVAGRLAGVRARVYHLRGLRLETEKGLRRRVLLFLERVAAASAHRVLAVSDSLKDLTLELRISKPERTVVLGAGSSNGVDVDDFDPSRFAADEVEALRRELGLIEGVPVVGFVGRLTADKGLPELSEAVLSLADQGVSHQLLVLGGRDEPELSSPNDVLGGGAINVVFAGHVGQPAIYYQLMDVLCLPTRREGFPNVALEAASSEVPVVTTTATGARDSVQQGMTGYLVAVGSSDELAAKLGSLLQDETKRRLMGANARRRASEDFARGKVWELNESFYRELVRRSNEVR